MAREDDDRLNRALEEWFDRTGRTCDWEAQRERIARAVEGPASQPQRPPERFPSKRGRRGAVFAVAIVAAIFLVTVVWQMTNRSKPSKPPGNKDPLQQLLAQLDPDELQRRLALLDELDELFADQWQWMIECGDRVEMQVAANPQNVPPSGEVAVRLAILVREDPAEAFRIQAKTFVLTREQQAVEATLENGVSQHLYFWAFPVDKGQFTYDLDVQATKPRELSISSSGIVAAGRPTKILSFQHDGREYRVYLLLIPGRSKSSQQGTRQL